MKKQTCLKKLSLLCLLLVPSVLSAQTWSGSGGNLTTTATKVGIGTTAPVQKLTIEDGNLALSSSAYPSDYGGNRWRYITAKTDVSVLHIGTNPDIVTGEANGPMIQMLATNNGWVPGRINYMARSSVGGSAGSTISHHFNNWNASRNNWVNQLSLLDIDNKAVALIGDVPFPTLNTYALIVDRGILTEKVRVAVKGSAEWADYVFADGYSLMPLKQLEEYINTENHLPEIPTTEEVIKNGIDIGQMQARLLQKVEELTLYVIAQQKEINALKKNARHKY